ncbi:hypothetical protein BTO32_15620 [Marinobacter lutaoensis]|uniref:Recombination-associated protein RdgC n=1 Tax=Marinobacter lutaoensis TaxID=135739 RepID=A0A1V2DQ24_9GAMM|nr:recombination-associated protein RdgC [Marinobacter lutaoensis]ONF42629.1 hypothetical protein BTO32_15620 [Marinobacter lutaoensis]
MKEFRVLNIKSDLPEKAELEAIAKAYPARECKFLEQSTLGFRELPGTGGEIVIQVEGSKFLYAELLRFRRSVPTVVRDREVRKRIKKLVESGEVVTKKLRATIKDEVMQELLPKMPQLETVIPLVIDQHDKRIWVGATSDKLAEGVFMLLRNAGLPLVTELWCDGGNLPFWLHRWLLNQEPLPESMLLGEKAKLADPIEPKSTVTISNEELTDEELQAVAASRSVLFLELSSPGMSFLINFDGAFKNLRFNPGEQCDDFAHEVAVCLSEIGDVVARLEAAIRQ